MKNINMTTVKFKFISPNICNRLNQNRLVKTYRTGSFMLRKNIIGLLIYIIIMITINNYGKFICFILFLWIEFKSFND